MRVIAQLVLTFLLNASWQSALLVAFAILCDWLLRGLAARYRHLLWVITLVSCLVLPLLSCAPLTKTLWRDQRANIGVTAKPIVISRILSPDVDETESSNSEAPASSIKAEPARRIFSMSPIHVKPSLAEALLALYVILLLWRMANLLRAWRRTRVIVKSAYKFTFPQRAQTIIQRCQAAIGSQRVRILCSMNVPVRITFGLINPVVILPERLLHEIDEELLTTAVGHELIHVARRDYLANLIYEFIYLPLSFHPAAALVRRRIKQTRELCCDESVAAKLLRADVYARSLVRMIGWAPPARRLAIDTTIGINESDILEVRIMSLLKTPKLSSPRRALLLIAAALLLLTPCVAAAKLGLSLDFERQDTAASLERQDLAVSASQRQSQELLERQEQQQKSEKLKREMQALKEQARTAPASQRSEIEGKLQEVQRVLDEQQRQFSDAEARLREVQQKLEEHERMVQQEEKLKNEKRVQDLRAALAQMEKSQPPDEARMRELREQLSQMEKNDGNRKAKLIYKVEPEYPDDARARKIEGSVQLGLTIDHDGVPQNIQIKRSLDPSLDQAAVDAIRKWRFEPAMKNGQPVSMWVVVEIYFGPGTKGLDQDQNEREAREKREMEERNSKETTVTTRRGITEGERKGELQGEEYGVLLNREAERRAEREMEAKQKAELASHARITMDHAIQIATSQTPGKVLECSLVGERWEAPGKLGKDSLVLYHVVVLSGDDASPVTYHVLVNAFDGTIFRTSKEERRIGFAESSGRAPIQGGTLNGKAISLPNPTYPAIARAAHAEGPVEVRITIDEEGNVVAAKAVSGHPLLQAAAVSAAREAKFAPSRLQGEPVRVSGVVVYNFTAQ